MAPQARIPQCIFVYCFAYVASVNMNMSHRIPVELLLASSRRTLLHGVKLYIYLQIYVYFCFVCLLGCIVCNMDSQLGRELQRLNVSENKLLTRIP
jgi:hypothetical protein